MATQPPPTEANEDTEVKWRNANICNVIGAVKEMGVKWNLIVLNGLRDSEKRFNELTRSTGASSYTLLRVLDDCSRIRPSASPSVSREGTLNALW